MMNTRPKNSPLGAKLDLFWVFVTTAILATLVVIAPEAQAQATTVTETVSSPNSSRIWKANKLGVEQGTSWRELGYDDSSWVDEPMRFYEDRGDVAGDGDYGFYFREEFEIDDIFQITDIELSHYYDDATVLYLNGVEIYRSIRNNLPDYDEVPLNGLMPVTTQPAWGGAESYYVQIPADYNRCERGCVNSGATSPVDVSLLQEGTNVFAALAFTTQNSDLGFDLGIDVVRNLDAPLPDQVWINEVAASNGILEDEDEDTPDWFELYNPGADPVSLLNWVVEDSGESWTFPNVTINPGGYLTVFASGKDRAPVFGELHTSFKISKELDSLRLVDAEGLVRDDYGVLPRQISDVAYGRPNDDLSLEPTYLSIPTPSSMNLPASTALDPVLRKFSNRLYNVGTTIDLQLDAFDPEGGELTYSMPNNQAIFVDPTTGAMNGVASFPGEFTYLITVTDPDLRTATQPVTFTILDDPTPSTPFVLNEYNAVAPDRELLAGTDSTFGNVAGNGGDWYEFLVVEDLLDLRGWELQLWDRDRDDEVLERAASLTFADDFFLAALPAGTIVTISEDHPEDLSFDPAAGDWTIDLKADTDEPGSMFAVQENFNSTRDDQNVEIRDADGVLRSPIVGETEAWEVAGNGGVNGGEVMNLCVNPALGDLIDAATDYQDVSTFSTFSAPNKCVYPDPADITGQSTLEFDQDLTALRASAGLRGDANCDGMVNVIDSLVIAQFTVGNRSDAGVCPLPDVFTQVNASNGDFDVSNRANVVDALLIAQCSVGIVSANYC